jgi:hypothetical protein
MTINIAILRIKPTAVAAVSKEIRYGVDGRVFAPQGNLGSSRSSACIKDHSADHPVPFPNGQQQA